MIKWFIVSKWSQKSCEKASRVDYQGPRQGQ